MGGTTLKPQASDSGITSHMDAASSSFLSYGLTSAIEDALKACVETKGIKRLLLRADMLQTVGISNLKEVVAAHQEKPISRTTGLLTLTASQFENLRWQSLFKIGGIQYELTNVQI